MAFSVLKLNVLKQIINKAKEEIGNMEIKLFEQSFEIVLILVTLSKIIHLHYESKTIKALVESAKTSNQRLENVEKEIRKLKS